MEEQILEIFRSRIRETLGLDIEDHLAFEVNRKKDDYVITLGDLDMVLQIWEEDDELDESPKERLEEEVTILADDYEREIREEIIDKKIEELEDQMLAEVVMLFREKLRDRGYEEEFLEEVTVEIVDMGYWPEHHTDMEEEYIRGWPEICLQASYLGDDYYEPVSVPLSFLDGDIDETENDIDELIDAFIESLID